MKNKKGFTLVELVIVIAVIAILAAVLLPTFATVIENAKVNSATQKATSALRYYFALVAPESYVDNIDTIADLYNYIIIVDNGENEVDYKFFVLADGSLGPSQKINHNAVDAKNGIGHITNYTLDTNSRHLDNAVEKTLNVCYIYLPD